VSPLLRGPPTLRRVADPRREAPPTSYDSNSSRAVEARSLVLRPHNVEPGTRATSIGRSLFSVARQLRPAPVSGFRASVEARAGLPLPGQVRPLLPRVGMPGERLVKRRATVRLSLVLGSAALHTHDSEADPGHGPVILDVGGRRVSVGPEEAIRLRDTAAASAGRSSAARDLSLLLDRGLHRPQVLALRRAEAQTLAQLASRIGLVALAGEIATPAA
jgi:hypothetical protein